MGKITIEGVSAEILDKAESIVKEVTEKLTGQPLLIGIVVAGMLAGYVKNIAGLYATEDAEKRWPDDLLAGGNAVAVAEARCDAMVNQVRDLYLANAEAAADAQDETAEQDKAA